MGWFEDIQNDIVIVTGEGSEFSPNWINAQKQKQFNTKEFDFPNTDGTLIIRKRPRSKTYNLELYFQGDDHLVESRRFDVASNDPRPWEISHPFYGKLVVQPSTITTDNSILNISKITCTVRETITTEGVSVSVAPVDQVNKLANDTAIVVQERFENVDISSGDVSSMDASAELTFERYNKVEDSQGLRNQYNTARSAIASAIQEPIIAMREVQRLLNFPSQFERSTQLRFETLKGEFDNLIESVSSIGSFFDRKYFENQGSATISAMCVSSITEPDFETRTQVFKQSEEIETIYDKYVEKLNDLQNSEGYFPDSEPLFLLEGLINFTVNNLNEIALNTQQERKLILGSDTNVVVLAHRLYGSKDAESEINRLIESNNIGLNEILQIKKGREITYYVEA